MMIDSPLGQVIALNDKHLVRKVEEMEGLPAPYLGGGVLKDAVLEQPFDAAAAGFVLACLPRGKGPVLWVQDRASRLENGRLYGPALPQLGFHDPVLRVEVSHARDVLWAMEEGASCGGLAGVVGEIHGAPPVLDFTATRRLALRAERSDVPIWLIRSGDPGALSAARERWRIGSRRSMMHPFDPNASGVPVWEAELFRARARGPGTWEVRHDGGARDPADRLRFLSRSGDGSLAADHNATSDTASG